MTIDRAIEILNPEHREHYDGLNEVNEACRMGMEALERQKWIPCSERLPEICEINGEMVDYQIFCSDFGDCGRADIGNYFPDAKEWLWMGVPVTVTHWMPLPEPPKEGDTEK